jgi:hypothetical protein
MAKKMPVERLIAASAIRAGLNYNEVNNLLAAAGFGCMNATSYKMVKNSYIPSIESQHTTYDMREHIFKPRRYNQLKE